MSFIHEIDTTLEAVKELIETGMDIDEKISYFFFHIILKLIYL